MSDNEDKQPLKPQEEKEGISFFGSSALSFRYVTNDTRKKRRAFCIGLFTVIIVVFFIGLLSNVVATSPAIFMRLAEQSVGEIDLLMTPQVSAVSRVPFLNSTDIDLRLKASDMVNGTAPRWIIPGTFLNRDDPVFNSSAIFMAMNSRREKELGIGRAFALRPLGEAECHVSSTVLRAARIEPETGGKVILSIDGTGMLERFGLIKGGTLSKDVVKAALQSRGLNFSQPIIVNTSFVRDTLGILLPNTTVLPFPPTIPVNPEVILDTLLPLVQASLSINMEYTVVGSITDPNGKYPTALGNIVLVDSEHLLRTVGRSVLGSLETSPFNAALLGALGVNPSTVTDALSNIEIDHYALLVIVQNKYRESAYMKDQKGVDAEMIKFTDSTAKALGLDYPASWSTPVALGLTASYFIRLFLDQIFNAVVALLIFLGSLLIFALLLANVDEKTYEYGMLRALGLKHLALALIIINQAMYFAVPGIGVGLFLAWLANIPLQVVISNFTVLPLNIQLNAAAILTSVIIGIVVPLFTNVIPIRRALSRTLRDSLDLYHQVFSETSVRMIKLEQLGLKAWQTSLALILIVVGFVTYYLIPYSFTFNDLPMFFTLLNLILAGMLIGLCMVAMVAQPFLERLILRIILWGDDRKMATLIRKNLAGHRKRSRKTFLMFTVSVAFIIFAGAEFALQARSIVDNIKIAVGGDIAVSATAINSPLNEAALTSLLNREKVGVNGRRPSVADFAFVSFDMTKYDFVLQTRFSNLAFYPSLRVLVKAVDRSYLQTTYNEFFQFSEYDKTIEYRMVDGKPDIIESLYSSAGKAKFPGTSGAGYRPPQILDGFAVPNVTIDSASAYNQYVDIICSEAVRTAISVSTETPLAIQITGRGTSQQYLAKTRAMVYKLPGFFFASYQPFAFNSPVLVSRDKFESILQTAADAAGVTPKASLRAVESVIVKLHSYVTVTERQDLVNSIRSVVDSDTSTLTDVDDVVASTKVAVDLITIFFDVVAVISTILSFFILWLSFTANVRENSWEFGVLRSIGLSVSKLIRAYVYEALCLVLASFLLGTIIGLSIAITLVTQFNLFLELPFNFDFPTAIFVPLFFMSLIVAFLGSYIPARSLRKTDIANVLKGNIKE